jgi:hypothetical protein
MSFALQIEGHRPTFQHLAAPGEQPAMDSFISTGPVKKLSHRGIMS